MRSEVKERVENKIHRTSDCEHTLQHDQRSSIAIVLHALTSDEAGKVAVAKVLRQNALSERVLVLHGERISSACDLWMDSLSSELLAKAYHSRTRCRPVSCSALEPGKQRKSVHCLTRSPH